MKNISILAIFACALLAGCQPANIITAKWDSGVNGVNAQTRCEQVDMRSKSEMDKVFPKYDGWKLIYISEYTTGNKTGTDGSVCFERTK
jgi:hypothetical protein